MEITLEAIEKVMEQAGVDYAAAKEALLKASGDAEEAIKSLQPKVCEFEKDVEKLANKVKETVKDGNVDRIQVKKGDEVLISIGVGMMYPITMQEEIKKMKKGRYGEQGMRFFKEHPNGSITCENVVTRCKACGNLEVKYDFNLLASRSESIDEKQDETVTKMHSDYEVEKYNHFCKKCGNKAEIVEDFEKKLEQGEISCPKCKAKLLLSDYLCWD